MKLINKIIQPLKVMQQFYIKVANTSVYRPLNRVGYLVVPKACVVRYVKAIEG